MLLCPIGCQKAAIPVLRSCRTRLSGNPNARVALKTTHHMDKKYFDLLQEVVEKTGMNAAKEYSIACGYANFLPAGELTMGTLSFKLNTVTKQHTAPSKKDLDRMISNIQEARRQADYVLVSMHSHKFAGTDTVNPAEFMQTYCRPADAYQNKGMAHNTLVGKHMASCNKKRHKANY